MQSWAWWWHGPRLVGEGRPPPGHGVVKPSIVAWAWPVGGWLVPAVKMGARGGGVVLRATTHASLHWSTVPLLHVWWEWILVVSLIIIGGSPWHVIVVWARPKLFRWFLPGIVPVRSWMALQ